MAENCVSTIIVFVNFFWICSIFGRIKRSDYFYSSINGCVVGAELMLLGFISLLLTVFQGSIIKMCVRESVTHHLLPCEFLSESPSEGESSDNTTETTSHLRRLLAEEFTGTGYCAAKVISLTPFLPLNIFL